MALGIEVNNIAPGLIERAGVDLSENIRALGKQVQMHIYENQTRKDLAAMAQQIQGLDVKSAELPEQLMQLSFQHPMATSDPRGQMAIKMLANANEKWIASQNRVSGMYGYAPGLGIYDRRTGTVGTAAPDKPVALGPNSRLVRPGTGEVLVEPTPLPEKPFNLSPGARRYNAQGNVIAENPKPAPTMSEYQRKSLGLRERAAGISKLKTQADFFEKDIQNLKSSIEKVNADERKLGKDQALPEPVIAERKKWQEKLEATKELRDATLKEMQKLETTAGMDEPVEPELGDVPPNAAIPQGDGLPNPNGFPEPSVLPALGDIIIVNTPDEARKLPKGTKFKTPDGRIKVR